MPAHEAAGAAGSIAASSQGVAHRSRQRAGAARHADSKRVALPRASAPTRESQGRGLSKSPGVAGTVGDGRVDARHAGAVASDEQPGREPSSPRCGAVRARERSYWRSRAPRCMWPARRRATGYSTRSSSMRNVREGRRHQTRPAHETCFPRRQEVLPVQVPLQLTLRGMAQLGRAGRPCPASRREARAPLRPHCLLSRRRRAGGPPSPARRPLPRLHQPRSSRAWNPRRTCAVGRQGLETAYGAVDRAFDAAGRELEDWVKHQRTQRHDESANGRTP